MKTTLKPLFLIPANAVLIALFLFCLFATVDLAVKNDPFAFVTALWCFLCGQGICVVQEMLWDDEDGDELDELDAELSD